MDYSLSINSNVLTITPDSCLIPNRQYTVTISPYVSGTIPPSGNVDVLSTEFSFWFTSTYCPLFSTLRRVKLLTGPSADVLLDDVIYRMIHKNSLDVVELYNLCRSSNYAYDYWGCDWQGAPRIFKRYVECKTAYDVLALIKQLNSAGSGNQLKTLGDMTIKYGANATGGNPALDSPSRMKEMYDCWNSSLQAIQSISVAARGYYDDSKGFSHPVRDTQHHRVIRPVIRNSSANSPSGPWVRGYPWRRFDI